MRWVFLIAALALGTWGLYYQYEDVEKKRNYCVVGAIAAFLLAFGVEGFFVG